MNERRKTHWTVKFGCSLTILGLTQSACNPISNRGIEATSINTTPVPTDTNIPDDILKDLQRLQTQVAILETEKVKLIPTPTIIPTTKPTTFPSSTTTQEARSLPTLSATKTETSAPTQEINTENWLAIQSKERGDKITLNNPTFKYLIRFPGDKYLAILEVDKSDGSTQRVYMENPNCQFQELLASKHLSDPVKVELGGTTGTVPAWEVKTQSIEEQSATVTSSYSLGLPIWLVSESFVKDDKTVVCPKEDSIFDPISNFWREIVTPLADKAYDFLKNQANK